MTSDAQERGIAARSLLLQLYPSPHFLGSAADPARVRFLAVPHARSPRLIADARSPRLASAATRHQSRSPRLRTRAAGTVLAAVARTGLYDRLPGARIVVAGPSGAPSIEDPLVELLGCTQLRIAMSIGPRRANRKPVLQVADEHGNVVAFVKVGHNELTRTLVRGESASLATLGSRPWEQVRLPQVLGVMDWGKLTLLALAPLQLPHIRYPASWARERLNTVADEIATGSGQEWLPWRVHPLRSRLRNRFAGSQTTASWLHQLDRLPLEVILPTGAWHGDLNPGNIAFSPRRCPVWDWERYESGGVPVGFDVLHYDLQRAVTQQRADPQSAVAELLRSSTGTLAPWVDDPDSADAICRAYLITLAERYMTDDQAAAGASLGLVDEWLLPVLRDWRA